MLIPDQVVECLSHLGIVVVAREARLDGSAGVGVRLEVPAEAAGDGLVHVLDLEVRRFSRPVSAAQLTNLAARQRRSPAGLLVVCPSASPSARRRAEEVGISLIAINQGRSSGPDGHLAVRPGEIVSIAVPNPEPDPAHRRSRRPAWGSLQVLRALAEGEVGTQAQLASRSSISQPRVSQVLKTLSQQGIVRSESAPDSSGSARRTWAVQSWGDFLEHWLEHYPGPGGVRTNWYGLDSPRQQARAVITLFAKQNRRLAAAAPNTLLVSEPGHRPRALVSGDVAAENYAPWARSQQAIVYTRDGADLEQLGLTPSVPDQATLVLVVPEDPGVWAQPVGSWRAFQDVVDRSDLPLADPLQVLFDVANSPLVDADQAFDHLKSRMIRQLASSAA